MRLYSDIVAALAGRLERTVEFTTCLLDENRLCVFLDGFNEVADRINHDIIEPIQCFIEQFPNVRLFIGSRPMAYEDVDFRLPGLGLLETRPIIPAFSLQPMHRQQVQTFVKSNYRRELPDADPQRIKEISKLLGIVGGNPNLFKMLQTPLHLMQFLRIYEAEPSVPPSLTVLTKRFLEWKYKRERDIAGEFLEVQFVELAQHYAWTVFYEYEKLGDNPAMPESLVREILRKYPHKVDISADKWLHHALNMTLFVRDKERNYQFVHQSYLEFFTMQDESRP
jgi:predicted NACHT family NTPase